MPAAAVTRLGCFTQDALDGLIQTNPSATQTITGDLTVTGAVSAGAVIDGGTYTGNLEVDGDLTITGDVAAGEDLDVTGGVTVGGTLEVVGATTLTAALGLPAGGFTMAAIARTATADGTGTGAIAAGPKLQTITVTVDDANKIITLPAPTVGDIVILFNGATGYELRTTDPTTIGINGGTGADAESAIPASTTAVLFCESATAWKGLQLSTTAGTLAKVEVAA